MSRENHDKNISINQMADFLSVYEGEPIKIMEVCGTHTAGIFKSGIRSILSDRIQLISGPGCPVCVTPTAFIDKCNEYSLMENHVLISFGDMLKVPGEEYSLSQIKGQGGQVSMVYSPFEVIKSAEKNPAITYVIAAVGFETTTPVFGLLLEELVAKNIDNVKLLTSLKSTIPAIDWVCENEPDIDAFLCPGHVSVITGMEDFRILYDKYKRPFVIAGFEEQHILKAIYKSVEDVLAVRKNLGSSDSNSSSIDSGGYDYVSNLYTEAVRPEGNVKAKNVISKYFDEGSAVWRGLGEIPNSGYYIKDEYSQFDAGSKGLTHDKKPPAGCRCSDVITGRINPDECPMFDTSCTPVTPYGPCMVSAEGACGIWYQNR